MHFNTVLNKKTKFCHNGMYHMADVIEELDVEFIDEVECEEFLDVP
jgi:hypothetical protein